MMDFLSPTINVLVPNDAASGYDCEESGWE